MGIFDINVPGNWILPDDQFWLAIVKPPYTGPAAIENDASRPAALSLANDLFSQNGEGQYPITINSPERNAVVLFPEFAFGSDDFGNLDALIRLQTRPVIVFAGFGAIRGEKLRAVIQEGQVLCGWQSGIQAVDATKRYNAAWCWIHDPRQNGANSHRCYILLKNWPEQRTERVGIPDLAGGIDTVRLVANDCTIFPLICADVLCNAANSPQDRIAASIHGSNLNRNKVLIAVLMLDGRPSNPAWSSRLAHLIQADPRKVAVVTCNHVSVSPLSAEADDQMRCLSGALVSIQQFSPDHREIPHPVRVVKWAGVAGYVLRSTAPGFAAGDFIWREIGLVNRFIWLPNVRATCAGNMLVHTIEAPVQVEMQRWCDRVHRPVWLNADAPCIAFLETGFARTRLALNPAGNARAIWPDALTGCGLDTNFSSHLDDAGKNASLQNALDEVFLIASSIFQTPRYNFDPLTNRRHFRRIATGGRASRDIVMWSSPDKLSNYQYQKVQEAAIDGRFDSVVVVVARGAGGTSPPFSRVAPDSMTDVGNGPPPADAQDIAEPPPLPIFWMPSGELETLLANNEWNQVPEGSRSSRIGVAVEELLDRTVA